MSLKVGIVGLPNVGKSTFFNALIKKEVAEIGDYPFTTIEPNVSIVEVPDRNLLKLKKLLGAPKALPATIKFVDIAGLIKNAYKGEGLGNQFLDHIRKMNALVFILRAFESKTQFDGGTPKEQLEIILEELRQKDRDTLVKKKKFLEHSAKTNKEEYSFLTIVDKMIQRIDLGENLFDFYRSSDKKIKKFIRSLFLLSLKPYLIVINVSEKDILKKNWGVDGIVVCAKTEKELCDLGEKEQKEYLEALGVKESALEKIIRESYNLLSLITFYTYKPKELVQAWSLKRGSSILKAASKIHSDFAKKFIKAEVINLKDLFLSGSMEEALKRGKIRIKGKDYIVNDKDLIYIHHS